MCDIGHHPLNSHSPVFCIRNSSQLGRLLAIQVEAHFNETSAYQWDMNGSEVRKFQIWFLQGKTFLFHSPLKPSSLVRKWPILDGTEGTCMLKIPELTWFPISSPEQSSVRTTYLWSMCKNFCNIFKFCTLGSEFATT